MFIIYLLCCLVTVRGAAVKEGVKDEHCTDPRTMRKHAAYTEWADAYSCTRHRCQPGGRNLAIYTVGCKRVEAPESAIECEEVVEDTNMQFPYCCTRLRCLVVVRGEVWTRVLGQPWETLPAAPWSHMYKMKKPPPVDGSFLPKGGPVYELADDAPADRRSTEKDVEKPVARSQPAATPDIVIALTTNNEQKPNDVDMPSRSKFMQAMEERNDQPNDIEAEETPPATEKIPDIISAEHIFPHAEKKMPRDRKFPEMMSEDEQPMYRGTKDSRLHKPAETSEEQYLNQRMKKQKPAEFSSDELYSSTRMKKQKVPDVVSEERMYSNVEKKSTRGPKSWAKIPQVPWNTNGGQRMRLLKNNDYDKETKPKVDSTLPINGESEEKQEKPASLQHLVNAIGTRMRDIENVVQQMSEKVQPPLESVESAVAYRRSAVGALRNYDKAVRNNELLLRMRADNTRPMLRKKEKAVDTEPLQQPKKPYNDDYNRFPPQQGGSKYLRTGADTTMEPPVFVGDNLNGYFSDPSNNLLRRSMRPNGPQEPQETYMVPINTDHKKKSALDSDDEPEVKHKKHTHKKKKSKHVRKKHRRDDREKKKFKKIQPEFENNVVSLEDSNDFGSEVRARWVKPLQPRVDRPMAGRPTIHRPMEIYPMTRRRMANRRQHTLGLPREQLMLLHKSLIKHLRNLKK